jgi:hypothetical protein
MEGGIVYFLFDASMSNDWQSSGLADPKAKLRVDDLVQEVLSYFSAGFPLLCTLCASVSLVTALAK